MHATDGDLRRLLDEPMAVSAGTRRHVADCAGCEERAQAIRATAQAAETAMVLAAAADARPDRADALSRIRAAAGSGRRTGTVRTGRHLAGRWRAAVAAAVAVGAIAASPVGSYANRLLTIFEPQQVQAVTLPTHLYGSLPDLNAYGTFVQGGSLSLLAKASAAAAQTATGLSAPLPSVLPGGTGAPTFHVLAQASGSFTFSAAKAAAAAAKAGASAPAMPAGLDGSTIRVDVGPAIIVTFPGPGGVATTGQGSGATALAQDLTAAVVKAPVVTSTGAGAGTIEKYLLSLPGVPSALAGDIQAIQNPVQTLPLPVPAGTTSQAVRVNGTAGVALSDTSGLYNAVVWENAGRIYAVAGPYTARQVLAAAQSVPQG